MSTINEIVEIVTRLRIASGVVLTDAAFDALVAELRVLERDAEAWRRHVRLGYNLSPRDIEDRD